MQVGVSAAVSSDEDVEFVRECERMGVTSVWIPEAWGYDALTPLAHLAAVTSTMKLATGIVQVGARSPAMLAMQAMSVQQMSGGRLVLGLGSSGPRIMEAWHGVPFQKPVATMRETIEIVRQIARGDRLEHHGEVYDLPLAGAGRGIRSMVQPVAPIPMVIAALGPKNLELTGAMGPPGKNFYNRAFSAQGYGDDVAAVYELWQAGKREDAAARVPFDIGFRTNLLGPPEVIRDRVRLYRHAGISTLQAKVAGPDRLDVVAQLVDLVREVNEERPGLSTR